MKAKALLLAGSLLLAPLSAHALVELGAKAVFWFPEISGDFEVGTGLTRQIGDVKDLTSDESALVGEVFLRGSNHLLSVSGARFDLSGPRGSLEYTMLDFAWEWDFINLENVFAGFSLGPVLQVKLLDGTLDVLPTVAAARFTEDFTAPVPLLGLGVHVGLLKDILEARARATAIGYAGNSLVDASAEVSYNPLPFIEVVGGYRHISIDLDTDNVAAAEGNNVILDFRQSGPYLGVAVKVGM
ncbi:MAG: hypothetical protein HY900_14870 [Deltaproteobacteria bacterium]|nr:hypothetical protein [Deltaproteobacteria bacterium]